MTTETGVLGEPALDLDAEVGGPEPVDRESGPMAQAAVPDPLEPGGKRLPFGWRS